MQAEDGIGDRRPSRGRGEGYKRQVRYATRDVDCAAPAVKARVETALERIDMAIADSSFARTLPSVSGLSGSRGGVSQP